MLKPPIRICLVGFLLDFAVMIGLTAMPFYVFNHLGGGAAMSGSFGAVQASAYAVTCILAAGLVSRTHNGLTLALMGMLVFTICFSTIPLSKSVLLCGGITVFSFVGMGLIWPALHSWVGAEPDPALRAKYMSWFNLSWSFGFAVSPLFAGPLYDLDYRLPFAVLFVLGMACVLILRTMPHEKTYFAEATPEMMDARAGHDRASEAHLHAAWCATFAANALIGVTRCVYPKRVDDLVAAGQLQLFLEDIPAEFLRHAAATKFSWLAGALALSTAITFIVLGKTSFWRHRFQVLFALQALSAAAFWALGTTRSLAVMMCCFVIVGVTLGVAFFSSAYYSLANPEHKHRRASINEGAVGLGGFVGSILFGYAVQQWGVALPFRLTPLFIALAVALQWALLRRGRNIASKMALDTDEPPANAVSR